MLLQGGGGGGDGGGGLGGGGVFFSGGGVGLGAGLFGSRGTGREDEMLLLTVSPGVAVKSSPELVVTPCMHFASGHHSTASAACATIGWTDCPSLTWKPNAIAPWMSMAKRADAHSL